MNRSATGLQVLWDLHVRLGRFTLYLGLGELRMKAASAKPTVTPRSSPLSFGGSDAYVPKRRGP